MFITLFRINSVHLNYFINIKIFQIISLFQLDNIRQLNGLEIIIIKWRNIIICFNKNNYDLIKLNIFLSLFSFNLIVHLLNLFKHLQLIPWVFPHVRNSKWILYKLSLLFNMWTQVMLLPFPSHFFIK